MDHVVAVADSDHESFYRGELIITGKKSVAVLGTEYNLQFHEGKKTLKRPCLFFFSSPSPCLENINFMHLNF